MGMTLGRLIKNAFFDYQTGGKEDRAAAEIQLRALAARADAAEMLAKAATVMQAHRNDGLSGALDMASEYSAAVAEHDEALAAWRAIEGEVMG